MASPTSWATAQASSRSATGRPMGTGTPAACQQALGQVLVLGDGLGHRAGLIDLGSLNAACLAAPAQLHQAAFG